MPAIGTEQTLTVVYEKEQGYYLGSDGEDILLPRKLAPKKLKEGDKVTVFLTTDSEGRPMATTEKSLITLGKVAKLKVQEVTPPQGAFLDWGLASQLWLPYREQTHQVVKGEYCVVMLEVDEHTGRPFATMKIEMRLERVMNEELKENQSVSVTLYEPNEEGFRAVINGQYAGFVATDDLAGHATLGDTLPGWVKRITKSGRVDTTLRRLGLDGIQDSAIVILDALKKNGGKLPLHDESSPEDIRDLLALSKKSFKRGLGMLLRDRKVTSEKGGIRILTAEEAASERIPFRKKDGMGEKISKTAKPFGKPGTKPFGARKEGFTGGSDAERKPFVKREEGSFSGSDKPARAPYKKRDEGFSASAERKPWAAKKEGYGDRPSRPWTDKKDSKPFEKRESRFGDDKPARAPYKKREEGFSGDTERKPFVKREEGSFSGSDKPARAPYKKRDEGFSAGAERKPWAAKKEGYGDRPSRPWTDKKDSKPFEKRESRFGDDKPARAPYKKREEGFAGDAERKPFVKREEGSFDKPARAPYKKRDEGFSAGAERKPWAAKKEGFGDRPSRPWTDKKDSKPFEKRESRFGDDKPARAPYKKREEGFSDGAERKPFVKREEGSFSGSDKPARAPYKKRDEGFSAGAERKPWAAKKEGFGDRPSRPWTDKKDSKPFEKRESRYGDDKPARAPYKKREEGFSGGAERKPFVKREEGSFSGSDKPAGRKPLDRDEGPKETGGGADRSERRPGRSARPIRRYRPGR